MHHTKRTKTLTGVTSLRLTPAEEHQVQQAAAKRSVTKSEWLRQAVLAAIHGSPETRLLLAELMALRAVVLSLQVDNLRGVALTEAHLADVQKQIEARKYAMADTRILALQSGEQQ